MKDARTEVLTGTRSLPPLECPTELAALVTDFWARHAAIESAPPDLAQDPTGPALSDRYVGEPVPMADRLPGAPKVVGGCHHSAEMTYGLFGKFTAQPGRRDDLVTYLLQAAKLLERNSGCIHYIVGTSDEPEAVWVWEVWINVAAHDASLEPEDIKALIQEARPLIVGMSDRTQLAVQSGKGLSG